MTNKLYNVFIEIDLAVLAESEEEAEKIALENFKSEKPFAYGTDFQAIPFDWNEDDVPYGGNKDKTIKELIEEGYAPSYKKPGND